MFIMKRALGMGLKGNQINHILYTRNFTQFSRGLLRSKYQNVMQNTKLNFRRFNSSKATQDPKKKPTGIKALMQQYGYSALGVYLGLSCIDLPLCYLLVESQGEEKIRELQNTVLSWIGLGKKKSEQTSSSSDSSSDEHSTIWTKFAFAYALHKSLIFIRVPITAAITPFVVSRLRSMGFNVGTIAASAASVASSAAVAAAKRAATGRK